jgi:hypothetical protein
LKTIAIVFKIQKQTI